MPTLATRQRSRGSRQRTSPSTPVLRDQGALERGTRRDHRTRRKVCGDRGCDRTDARHHQHQEAERREEIAQQSAYQRRHSTPTQGARNFRTEGRAGTHPQRAGRPCLVGILPRPHHAEARYGTRQGATPATAGPRQTTRSRARPAPVRESRIRRDLTRAGVPPRRSAKGSATKKLRRFACDAL